MSALLLSRRGFFKVAGVVGGGLLLAYYLNDDEQPHPLNEIDGALNANAFLQVTPENEIVFYLPRDEMGQGVYMGLSTLVAEELDVPLDSLKIEFAGVHEDYNNPEFGVQVTGGSTSMRHHYRPLREFAAKTRQLILQAAAQDLNVPQNELSTQDTQVLHATKKYPYSDFLVTANTLELPSDAVLKRKDQYRYIGKEIARVDALAKSTGTAVYGIDIDVPDMHYAVLNRCPVYGGKVKSFDDTKAKAVAGVTDVVEIENGVAVVASTFWPAKKASALLDIEWDMPELATLDSATIQADYRTALASDEGDSEGDGNVDTGFEQAEKIIEREYWAPYLAHAPMEPLNAVVRVANGKAELWSGTQGPTVAQGLVARYANIAKENVTVHSTFLGGGFGRRGVLTHIAEATQIAVATDKTVKLVWTREHDIQQGWNRPASLMKVRAGINSNGEVTAWDASRVGGNIFPDTLDATLPGVLTGVPKGATNWLADVSASVFDGWLIDSSSIEGLMDNYDFPNKKVRHVTVDHKMPLTFWRSVGHSFTAFAKEAMIDELAEASGLSPIEFRLRNLRNNERLANTLRSLQAATNEWQISEGHAIGVAAHGSFESYVAQAVDISIENSRIKVHRVACVIDCGQVINPDIVRGQMEGSIMFGLTAALYGELDIEAGRIKQSNFHDYQILRMDEAPVVDVIIVESDQEPSGVGEPGLPPIAPAVANAVYRLSQQRLSSLPFKLA